MAAFYHLLRAVPRAIAFYYGSLRLMALLALRVLRREGIAVVCHRASILLAQREMYAAYGTKSFPSEERILEERREIAAWGDAATLPRFSILTPLYNTPEAFLREMIESVLAQTYENWELCLADGSDSAHSYVERVVQEYMARDNHSRPRIGYKRLAENKGISENTNACLAMASGNYIGLLDHDDILHPEALYLYAKEILERGAEFLYCDEASFASSKAGTSQGASNKFAPQEINRILTMHFKPDYAIDNLRANNYICHFSVFKKDLLEREDLFRAQFDGSQDHDMILRLTGHAKTIVHVPRILYYWRSHEGSAASGIEAKPYAIDAAKGAVADHLKRYGFEHFSITPIGPWGPVFKISYAIEGNPKVSIVIPSRDHADDLKRCIDSITEKSTWGNYEIVVVENGSVDEKTSAYYRSLLGEGRVRVTPHPSESAFNFSDVVNFGVAQTDGDYVLLLNNDTEVIAADWMEELLMYAQRDDVGAVGAKLFFPDNTIQHAGVVLGLGAHRTAGHSHYGASEKNSGNIKRLRYAQNVSAVTGACLMVSRKKFDEVNGLDASFAVSLNDVDFCLRLRAKGYLNVFTPFAQLSHYESKSRGLDTDGENAKRYEKESAHFRERWKILLEQGDPYYNPNFSLDHADFLLRTSV